MNEPVIDGMIRAARVRVGDAAIVGAEALGAALLRAGVPARAASAALGAYSLLAYQGRRRYACGEVLPVPGDPGPAVDDYVSTPPQFGAGRPAEQRRQGPAPRVVTVADAGLCGASSLLEWAPAAYFHEAALRNADGRFLLVDPILRGQVGRAVIVRYDLPEARIPEGIALSGNFSFNYYHFLVELMARKRYLDAAGIPRTVPLLVDAVVMQIPQLASLLELFNPEGRPVVWLEPSRRHRIGALHLVPTLSFVPQHYVDFRTCRSDDCAFHVESLLGVRETCLAHARGRPSPAGRRLYLCRRDASGRRRFNEDAVIPLVERLGFEVVFPERHAFLDQVALFRDAEVVVGVSGAAFTNLLFASPGCRALCIQSMVSELSIFSSIARLVGVDLRYLAAGGPDHRSADPHEAFTLDLADLEPRLVDLVSG